MGSWGIFIRSVGTFLVLMALTSSCGKSGLLTINAICESSLLDISSITVSDRYAGARNWTYYVQAADTSQACVVGGGVPCLHAGEGREVVLTGVSSCDGLSATDSAGAFNWFCREESGNAIFAIGGFATDKGLVDLIDMSTEEFTDLSVSVSDSCAIASTQSSKWWTNAITALPANPANGNALILIDGTDDDGAGPDEVYVAGSILYLDGDRDTGGYSLGMDNLAIVMNQSTTLTYNGFFNPNVNANGAPGLARRTIIGAQNADFVWIEGNFDGRPAGTVTDHHLLITSCEYLRLHNIEMQTSEREGIFFRTGNNYAYLDNIKISEATRNCIRTSNGTNNMTILNAEIFDCDIDGISIDGDNYLLSNVQIANTTGEAIAASSNIYEDLILSQILVTNSSATGLLLGISPSLVLHATSTNSTSYGISLPNLSTGHTLHNILTQNNNIGLLSSAPNTNISDITSTYNQTAGIQTSAPANNGTFSGAIMVGNNTANCVIGAATDPGLSNAPTDCSVQGTSTHTTTLAVDTATTFVGRVTSDGTNTQVPSIDTSAIQVTEPFNFDYEFISWGPAVSGDHYDVTNVGAASIGADTLFAWDWGLSSADAGNSGAALALGVNPCPSGNTTHTHNWGGGGSATFLRYAIEIFHDGLGNDDSLCESNEACLYAPNRGAYQGHGERLSSSLVSGCEDISSGGTVENVILYEYQFNGH